MHVGLLVDDSLEATSGGHIYDRKLVDYLRGCGDSVEVFTLPKWSYARHLAENVIGHWPQNFEAAQLDVLLQDEASHPALLQLNRRLHRHVSYPIVSLVHRLCSAETRSPGVRDFYRWIERRYLTSVDGLVCHSETTQRAVSEMLRADRARSARSIVVPPGGDRFAVALTPEDIRQRSRRRGPLRLVFVGDLIRRKGLLVLLEALLKLPAGRCQLTVVGNADVEALYMRVVYHLFMVTNLSGVTLAGVVGDDELATILGQGDVLIVPAEYAGAGTIYREGMGFGLPAIGTTSGAAGEIITNGVNGHLIPPNDPTALANCLMSLIADRAKLAEMSLAARESFLAQPGWMDSLARVRQALLKWIDHPADPD
jgi:glycosyltransferase involved in cell wall biosynthesis